MGQRRAIPVLFAVAILAACTQAAPEQPEETEQPEQTEPADEPEQPEASEGAEDAADDETSPAPEGSANPANSADPAADPADANSVTIPPCESLLSPSELGDYFIDGVDTVEHIPTPENWGAPSEHMIDDDTRYIMQQASDSVSCTWGMPFTDNFFSIIITPLDGALTTQLTDEIAAQDYGEFRPPTPGYSFNVPDASATGVHIVAGDVWFLFQGGPGSVHADDAERHRFAEMLATVRDRVLP